MLNGRIAQPSPTVRQRRSGARSSNSTTGLLEEWAYIRPYSTDTDRCAALPQWLHYYNHHRGHTALGGRSPADRVTNLSGQYN
ncbi:integrase core domain-containing protein [Blastococcus jejuensis]|uniref:integrase core domain-containing protein n=1 Tax=Blastococcus jejuensis TaxID=351224 RepID=UPI003CD05DD4